MEMKNEDNVTFVKYICNVFMVSERGWFSSFWGYSFWYCCIRLQHIVRRSYYCVVWNGNPSPHCNHPPPLQWNTLYLISGIRWTVNQHPQQHHSVLTPPLLFLFVVFQLWRCRHHGEATEREPSTNASDMQVRAPPTVDSLTDCLIQNSLTVSLKLEWIQIQALTEVIMFYDVCLYFHHFDAF